MGPYPSEAGLGDVHLHDLRHSFAVLALPQAWACRSLAPFSVTAIRATTARYAHLANDPRRVAAARISDEIAASLRRSIGGRIEKLLRHTCFFLTFPSRVQGR